MADPVSQSPACPDGSFGPWAGSTCRGGFDLTLLFEEAILAIPVDTIFLLVAAVLVRRRGRQEIKLQHNTDNRFRSICKLVGL